MVVAATATERSERIRSAADPDADGVVERYGRATRWLHAGVYLTVLIVGGTGWWLLSGREGDPTPLARLTGVPDVVIHKDVGWALIALIGAGVVFGVRATGGFVAESVRFRRSDAHWLLRWPQAVFTGRFARHEGHFDPGQRVLNILLSISLLAAIGSGVGLVTVHGGPVFVQLDKVHKWATYALTALVAGHVLVAAGVLPGYRGVWRSMHIGGRLRTDVARRLWPGWLERRSGAGKREN